METKIAKERNAERAGKRAEKSNEKIVTTVKSEQMRRDESLIKSN